MTNQHKKKSKLDPVRAAALKVARLYYYRGEWLGTAHVNGHEVAEAVKELHKVLRRKRK